MARLEREELKRRLEFSERKRSSLLRRVLSHRNPEEDTLLWSMADLMTLLLIFFILFYSHELTRTDSTAQAAAKPGNDEFPSISRTVAPAPQPPATAPRPAAQPDETLEELRLDILETLNGKQGDFSVHWDRRRLVLVLGERVTFNIGEAELLVDFQPTLNRISDSIARKNGYRVVVAGHTDDTPINTPRFPSNWELSTARAVNVAKFLVANGVDPGRVSIEGYSHYRPVAENTTPENKRTNRRVEITLIKDDSEGPRS